MDEDGEGAADETVDAPTDSRPCARRWSDEGDIGPDK